MDRPRWQRRPVVAVAAAVLVGVAVVVLLATSGSGRSGRSAEPRASATSSTASPVPVAIPGRPGQSASTISSDRLPDVGNAPYNSADVAFIRMMIPHHLQAVQMAALAPTRAREPQVLAIADRVRAAQ